MSRLFLLLACSLALLCAPAARAGEPDPAIKAQLESLPIKYEVDDDGDYKIVFDLGGGRTQLVWIRSKVETYGSLKVRELWSAGYKLDGKPLSAAMANRLLEHSHGVIMGSWTKQKTFAMFVVKLPVGATAKQLRDAAEAASDAADEIEKEFTAGKDDF